LSQLVELVFTDQQVGLLAAAVDTTLRSADDEEHGLLTLEDEERTAFEQLQVFLTSVFTSPRAFPVTGRMAIPKKKSVAEKLHLKGTSESTRNKRKARQAKRQGGHKRRRLEQRKMAANYNQARTVMEAELQEIQEIQEQRQAEIALEPKFDITDIMGNVVIAGVPESMIRPAEVGLTPEQLAELASPGDGAAFEQYVDDNGREEIETKSKIILPGSAEHLGVDVD